MATATLIPEKTEVVVIQEETVGLNLNRREAEIVMALLAHTRDVDEDFQEVREVYKALRAAGIRYDDFGIGVIPRGKSEDKDGYVYGGIRVLNRKDVRY